MERFETSDQGRFRIILTAQRREGRFLVWLDDNPAWLSYSQFKLLVSLVKHHVDTGGLEFISKPGAINPSAVCRLRRAVDEVAGSGAGRELIETGVGAEYRLAPATRVQVDGNIVRPTRLIPASLLEKLEAA